MIVKLHFVHGFLGFPSDWNVFKNDFEKYHCKFYSIPDFMPTQNYEISYFNSWASKFNFLVFKDQASNQKNILIGYSLGGRLALHSLFESDKWDAAIVISANPGLSNESEKQARIANDNMWAERFLNENWKSVMDSWNSQGVFSCMKNDLSRDEKLFNKQEISNILNGFSLGKQEDLREKIKTLQIPILWLAGEKDVKFAKVAQEMKELNNKIDLKMIADAGHRVPWEKQEEFKKACFSFIDKIS